MTWEIKWSEDARKALRKLDHALQKKVIKYLSQRIAKASHPSDFGKPLRYDKYGLWRYRVEDTRIICQIREDELIVLVLNVGHRRHVYH